MAEALLERFDNGISIAPQHAIPAEDLSPAIDDEESAAALWQQLLDAHGKSLSH